MQAKRSILYKNDTWILCKLLKMRQNAAIPSIPIAFRRIMRYNSIIKEAERQEVRIMTAKRYHKLFRSEMSKLMAHKPGANQCIRAAATARPHRADGNVIPYGEMWAALRAVYTYPGNIPPVK